MGEQYNERAAILRRVRNRWFGLAVDVPQQPLFLDVWRQRATHEWPVSGAPWRVAETR